MRSWASLEKQTTFWFAKNTTAHGETDQIEGDRHELGGGAGGGPGSGDGRGGTDYLRLILTSSLAMKAIVVLRFAPTRIPCRLPTRHVAVAQTRCPRP